MLAMKFARVRGTIDQEKFAGMLTDLRCLPDQFELLLGRKEKIQHFANRYVGARDIFFIGRGIDYAISLEGSLKLKEISYIHSEAYAAGELKHGTISLIEDGTLVVALATQPDLFQKTISNMVEVKACLLYTSRARVWLSHLTPAACLPSFPMRQQDVWQPMASRHTFLNL